MLTLIEPLELNIDYERYDKIFTGKNYEQNKRILNAELRKLESVVPPLINAYMNLSPTMRTFGTSLNREFGNVEETAILIKIADIYPSKIDRHVTSYLKYKESITKP